MAVMSVACRSERQEAAPVRVAAASDLTAAFEVLGRAFEEATQRPVTLSFGSTGLLAKQLREGAPFDLFAAASVSFVDEVVAAGACDGTTTRAYGHGRMTLWSRRDDVAPPSALAELTDPRFRRIALANPEYAPYGRAAKEALERAGLWSALEPRVVYADNVRQALQFAETGNVEVALVALSLVVRDRDNPWRLVDDDLHRPIEQALVVCNHGQNEDGGRAFSEFVSSEKGRAILRQHGFLLPGESLPPEP